MRWDEQGLRHNTRYTVVPRTLVFVTHGRDILLLRGAPGKRLWASKLNGVGGHVEPDETPLAGACREVREETGLEIKDLTLGALVHIAGHENAAGVLLFVYTGEAPSRQIQPTIEGQLDWYPLDALPYADMLDDLGLLLPRLFTRRVPERMLYGHYTTNDHGQMIFHYTE
jgi:8-oxo-dGTP diphosphatase